MNQLTTSSPSALELITIQVKRTNSASPQGRRSFHPKATPSWQQVRAGRHTVPLEPTLRVSHVQMLRNWMIQRCLQNSLSKVNPEADIYMKPRFLMPSRREQLCLPGFFTWLHLEPRFPARPPKSTPPSVASPRCRFPLCPQPQRQPRTEPSAPVWSCSLLQPPCLCCLVPSSMTRSLLPRCGLAPSSSLLASAPSSLPRWHVTAPTSPHTLTLEPPPLALSFLFHCSPSNTPNNSPKPSPSPRVEAPHRKGPSSVLFTSIPQAHSLAQREPFLNLWCSDDSINECGPLEALPALQKRSHGPLAPGMANSPMPRGLAGGPWPCRPWLPSLWGGEIEVAWAVWQQRGMCG